MKFAAPFVCALVKEGGSFAGRQRHGIATDSRFALIRRFAGGHAKPPGDGPFAPEGCERTAKQSATAEASIRWQ